MLKNLFLFLDEDINDEEMKKTFLTYVKYLITVFWRVLWSLLPPESKYLYIVYVSFLY